MSDLGEVPEKEFYALFYGSSFVRLFMGVLVENRRGWIPVTQSREELTITKLQYRVGKMVEPRGDDTTNLDHFLEVAGIRVVP